MPDFINDDKIYISIKPLHGSYRVLQAPEGTPEIVFLNWDTEMANEESDHAKYMSQADHNEVNDVFGA